MLKARLQCKQRALDIRLKLFGEEHLSSTAGSYSSFRNTQYAQGDLRSVFQPKQLALEIDQIEIVFEVS